MNKPTADFTYQITELIDTANTELSLNEAVSTFGIPFCCPCCNKITPITLERINKVITCTCGKTILVSDGSTAFSEE